MGIHMHCPTMMAAKREKTGLFYALDGDGYLKERGASYALAREGLSADTVDTASDYVITGQFQGATYWDIWRGVYYFDLGKIQAAALITKATLSLFTSSWSYQVADPFDVVIVDGRSLAATLEASDYGRLLSKTVNGGSRSIADLASGAYHDFEFTEDGRTFIKTAGIAKIAIRSSFDITAYEKFGSYIGFSADKGWLDPGDHTLGYKPKLYLEYKE